MSTVIDHRLEVETPEHVALSYTLAGAGSRFTAAMIDGLILAGTMTAVTLAFAAVAAAGLPTPVLSVTAAIWILGSFMLGWGYFIFFEGFREGQTPGKKRMGLRVVYDGGFPLTARGAVIRNLLRLVDGQPFPSFLLGGLCIVLNRKAQRLGDMAAGTIVVREQPVPALPEEAGTRGPPRMSDQEYDIVRQYALRRANLEAEARTRIAVKLLPHFAGYGRDLPQATHLDPNLVTDADALLAAIHADEAARRTASGHRAGSGSPAAAALLRRQRPRWAQYESMLNRAREQRLTSLSEDDVSRFAALYRETAADLARARTYDASADMLYTLERAVGAGHNLFYTPPVRSPRRAWRWITVGFPALVRRRAAIIMLAALLLYGPAIITSTAIVRDPARAPLIVPSSMIARAEEGAARRANGEGYVNVPEVFMPFFSSSIIANNVQVTFMAFAGGILLGLGTMFTLIFNGVVLGGVAGLFHSKGLGLYLWSFVLPHGFIELTAICIAGGAGMLIGSAIVLPGRRTRRAALTSRAAEAASLLGGTVVMLVIAGLIEGFISPSMLPDAVKLAFGALMAILVLAWLLLGGRDVTEDSVVSLRDSGRALQQ